MLLVANPAFVPLDSLFAPTLWLDVPSSLPVEDRGSIRRTILLLAGESIVRLVDVLMQSARSGPPQSDVERPVGTDGGALASSIASCTLRYVLDRSASQQCVNLMYQKDGVLERADELVRLPGKPFWLECFPDGTGDTYRAGRLGFYVDPRADGYGGSIHCVSETEKDVVAELPGWVEFDLISMPPIDEFSHRMRYPDYGHLDRLLCHARLVFRSEWMATVRTQPQSFAEALRVQAERAWGALPFVLSFTALLNARNVLAQRPSSLCRLNAARARIGRPALIDHIEVGMNLLPAGPPHERGDATGGSRHTPRFHFVRGHNVTRAGRTFWRSSHFRGDGTTEIMKTVNVTAGRRRAVGGGDRHPTN